MTVLSLLRSFFLPALVGALAVAGPAAADERRVTFQAFGGGAVNAPASLTVSQDGQPDIEETVTFKTKPFESPFYWALRLGLEDRAGAWELQVLHDKLYLDDPPAGIDHFEVTHGFNLVTLGRAFSLGHDLSARVGAGAAVTHTEASVRGEWSGGDGTFSGYEVAGPVVLAGLGWQLPLGRHFFVSLEAAASVAYVRVSVSRGHASFWNVAGHGLLGLGVRFGGPL